MTAMYREEARDALRLLRYQASVRMNRADLIAKLKVDVEKPTPVILDHATVRSIINELEAMERVRKAVGV